MTKLSYFDDPNCLEFQAEVISVIRLEDGSIAVLLAQTFFYPTGGGQGNDEGWIGDARVIDVVKQENGKVLHILDREILKGEYPARIDNVCRTILNRPPKAQNILSQLFQLEYGLKTLSSNISCVHPSTIDLNTLSISDLELKTVEDGANKVVINNLLVKTYFISDKEISSIPFRRPPKVTGDIRVVEIEGYDYSACGGTHCERTGSVGLIKILKTEIQNKKLRIHFIAGYLAVDFFQETYGSMTKIANLLETGLEQVDLAVKKQVDSFQQLHLKTEEYRKKYLDYEKDRLLSDTSRSQNVEIIAHVFEDIDLGDLRYLANAARIENSNLVVLASHFGSKLSMVVSCSEDSGLDARQVLNLLLEKHRGKGGGDKYFAQGGGKFQPGTLDDLNQVVVKILDSLDS